MPKTKNTPPVANKKSNGKLNLKYPKYISPK